jgi:hypothetical protein
MMVSYTSSVIIAGFLGLDAMREQLRGKPIQHQIFRLAENRKPLAFQKEVNAVLLSYIDKCKEDYTLKKKNTSSDSILELVIREKDKGGPFA